MGSVPVVFYLSVAVLLDAPARLACVLTAGVAAAGLAVALAPLFAGACPAGEDLRAAGFCWPATWAVGAWRPLCPDAAVVAGGAAGAGAAAAAAGLGGVVAAAGVEEEVCGVLRPCRPDRAGAAAVTTFSVGCSGAGFCSVELTSPAATMAARTSARKSREGLAAGAWAAGGAAGVVTAAAGCAAGTGAVGRSSGTDTTGAGCGTGGWVEVVGVASACETAGVSAGVRSRLRRSNRDRPRSRPWVRSAACPCAGAGCACAGSAAAVVGSAASGVAFS